MEKKVGVKKIIKKVKKKMWEKKWCEKKEGKKIKIVEKKNQKI